MAESPQQFFQLKAKDRFLSHLQRQQWSTWVYSYYYSVCVRHEVSATMKSLTDGRSRVAESPLSPHLGLNTDPFWEIRGKRDDSTESTAFVRYAQLRGKIPLLTDDLALVFHAEFFQGHLHTSLPASIADSLCPPS